MTRLIRLLCTRHSGSVTTLLAVSGPLAGVLIGWFISRQSDGSSPSPTATQRQLDHICEIDRRVSSALTSLQAYEKRILVGRHLEQNGRTATTLSASAGNSKTATPSSTTAPRRGPLGEPLDGKTLLTIKREVDEQIRACTDALIRATAVLEEEAVLRAQEMIDALVAARETLEAQEGEGDACPDEMSTHVTAIHRARTRLLHTARQGLHLESLSPDATERVERLGHQSFSPSHVPRPYMTTGVRVSEERL